MISASVGLGLEKQIHFTNKISLNSPLNIFIDLQRLHNHYFIITIYTTITVTYITFFLH